MAQALGVATHGTADDIASYIRRRTDRGHNRAKRIGDQIVDAFGETEHHAMHQVGANRPAKTPELVATIRAPPIQVVLRSACIRPPWEHSAGRPVPVFIDTTPTRVDQHAGAILSIRIAMQRLRPVRHTLEGVTCCKGTQAGMIPPRPQVHHIAILPLARISQATRARPRRKAYRPPGIRDPREGQRPSAIRQLREAALGVKQCVAEGVGRARDRALGVQPLGAIGIQLLIAIAADGGEDTREGGLLVQDEVGAQAYSSVIKLLLFKTSISIMISSVTIALSGRPDSCNTSQGSFGENIHPRSFMTCAYIEP